MQTPPVRLQPPSKHRHLPCHAAAGSSRQPDEGAPLPISCPPFCRESAPRCRHHQWPDPGFPCSWPGAGDAGGLRVWCGAADGCLLRGVPAAQHAAAPVCGRGVHPGVHPGAGTEPAGVPPGDTPGTGRGSHDALLGADRGGGGGRGGRAGAGVAGGQRAAAGCRDLRHCGADDALDVSVHPADFAGGAGGRHPEPVETLCGTGLCAGAAECVDHSGGALSEPLLRSARAGAVRGGDDRRGAAAAVAGAVAGEDRPVAPHPFHPLEGSEGSGRAAGAEEHGPDAAGGVGVAVQSDHQHADRLVAGAGQCVVGELRRPADGVSNLAAGHCHGHAAAAQPVAGQCRRQHTALQ